MTDPILDALDARPVKLIRDRIDRTTQLLSTIGQTLTNFAANEKALLAEATTQPGIDRLNQEIERKLTDVVAKLSNDLDAPTTTILKARLQYIIDNLGV